MKELKAVLVIVMLMVACVVGLYKCDDSGEFKMDDTEGEAEGEYATILNEIREIEDMRVQNMLSGSPDETVNLRLIKRLKEMERSDFEALNGKIDSMINYYSFMYAWR